MRNAEAQIQAEIVRFIRASAPDAIVFSVQNDGLFTKSECAKRKWTGVLPGVPDLILLAPGGRCFGIEVKRPGGVVSQEQRAMMGQMATLGVPVAVVHSLAEARNALSAWQIAFAPEKALEAAL